MCDLSTTISEEKMIGYKVVAKRPNGKRYFSIAMGFKYPLDGHVPVVRKQHLICVDFVDDIISKMSVTYRKNMVGRTSIFLSLADVRRRILSWRRYVKEGYKLVIVTAEVSVDVMVGLYGPCSYSVAAGRHIRFIDEV